MNGLWFLFRDTFLRPRDVAGQLMALGLRRDVLWMGAGLASVLSALFFGLLTQTIAPLPEAWTELGFNPSPLSYALLTFAGIVISVFAIQFTGQMLEGKGAFEEALVLIVWLQLAMFVLRVGQLLILLAVPVLGAFVTLATVGASLWAILNFTAALHRFDGVGKAALVLVLAFTGIIFGLAFIMMLIGVGTVGVSGNV